MPSANRFESLFSPFKLSRHKGEAGHTCIDRIKSVISVFDANPSLGCVRLQSKRFISAFDASSPLGCFRAGALFQFLMQVHRWAAQCFRAGANQAGISQRPHPCCSGVSVYTSSAPNGVYLQCTRVVYISSALNGVYL